MNGPIWCGPHGCDCFDLPDGNGGTIAARAIHAAHVATLAAEFCGTVSTAALIDGRIPA